MEIVFLELNELLEIHEDQVHRYGGASGIRSMELLQSAAAMPTAGFGGQYFHKDLYEMAAAYLFHIANNHPFVDGNKRTAAAAANTFLLLNNLVFSVEERKYELLVRAVATGKADKHAIAAFFRIHTRQKK